MKLALKSPNKLRKRHIFAMVASLAIVAGASSWLFVAQRAQSAIASDDKFRVVMPSAFTATQSTDVYLEIAQLGAGNTLDAKESWSKFYIDENRVDDATIGVFRGGYGGEIDSLGINGGSAGQRLPDPNSVKYDFYLARDTVVTISNGDIVSEEVPCRINAELAPSLTVQGGEMPVDGWYKIDATRFKSNAKCGTASWEKTKKTGKYVLFMRASWNSSAPKSNGVTQGRVNAYKVGAAYANSSGNLDNPLTGYWSDFFSATQNPQQVPSDRAAYSVQDRKSPDGTQGDYTFKFAPDCRMARGVRETRYLHWKDVDYPDYYTAPYPNQPAPEFDLIEITPAGNRSTVLRINKDSRALDGGGVFNGPGGQNEHASIGYEFKGGHTYEWKWKNITRIDGVSFWLPYDDYPSLAGCGSYEHKIGMWGSRGEGWTQGNFEATGGDTLQFLVDESYVKGTAAAPDTTSNAYLRSPNGALYANTFADPGGATGISDGGKRVGRAQVQWELPGMGPSSPYTNKRWLLFNYPIKADAQNGAVHCFNSDMTPKSNTDPLGILTSNTICVTINNSLKPFLSTSGGDVHAGNDCVITTAGNGKITGPPVNGLNLGSSGSYIVSAGDRVTDFGSGNSPNSSALTFGKTGYYGSICRPVLTEAEVNKAIAGGAVEVPFSGLSFNASSINSLPDNKKYVVKLPAGTPVSGIFTRSVTIYSSGDINIVGDLRGDTGGRYAKNKLPVVGVVAGGDINISAGVTQLDALLYSLDEIDTCSGQDIKTAGGVAACKPALTLNGFAMAKSFSFKRTTGTAGLVRAENVIFNAAFYLNTPPVLGTAAGAVKYLGERAPLY